MVNPMSEMIDLAALKVRVKMMDSFGYEMSKEESIALVRTTIEAMRVPTDGMLDYRDAGVKRSDALLVWQHQIDEALK